MLSTYVGYEINTARRMLPLVPINTCEIFLVNDGAKSLAFF